MENEQQSESVSIRIEDAQAELAQARYREGWFNGYTEATRDFKWFAAGLIVGICLTLAFMEAVAQ